MTGRQTGFLAERSRNSVFVGWCRALASPTNSVLDRWWGSPRLDPPFYESPPLVKWSGRALAKSFTVACPTLLSERRPRRPSPNGCFETVEGNGPIYRRALSPRVGRAVPFSPGRDGDSYPSRRILFDSSPFKPLVSIRSALPQLDGITNVSSGSRLPRQSRRPACRPPSSSRPTSPIARHNGSVDEPPR
jgi:hypothetical protein